MITKTLNVLFLIMSFVAFAQTNYYKTTNGTILTELEIDVQKKKITDKIAKKHPKAIVALKILDKEIKGDSIINEYSFHVDLTLNESKEKEMGIKKYINKPLPATPFFDTNGIEYQVSDFAGKPTLLNFWFTSCKPCVDEIPELNKLKKHYGDRVNFVAITFESKENVEKFLRKKDFHFSHIINAQDYLDVLQMQSYPKNIILDKNGMVKSITSGIAYVQGTDGKLKMGEATELKNELYKLLK